MKNIQVVLFLMLSIIICPLNISAQGDDPVLLSIDGREITLSEFEYVYSKNNLNTQVVDPKSVDEYLDLFINFNLKVQHALELGLDTNQSFITELEGYRKQLAQPYLNDQDVTEELVEEAYERMQYDVRASHILISVEQHAAPQDTLAAWNKINDLRNRVLAGENFGELAKEFSDDPSASGMPATANRPAMRPNYGDLGYFNVLNMVYPFESAAYATDINEVSEIVRTNFGYHIIKVTDKIPAMGRAKVAHLMVNAPVDAPQEEIDNARDKIDEIYQKLLQGESFEELVQNYSDDKASARRNGEIPPFTSNRMVPEFIKAINELEQPDEISEPVRTQFGWHLIRLIEKEKPSREEAIADLKSKITKDSRAVLSQKVIIDRIKKEYDFTEQTQNLELFFTLVDERIFQGRWTLDTVVALDKELFEFDGITYLQKDFADYLKQNQTMRSPETVRNYVNTMYEKFSNEKLLEYEESMLEAKFPEFQRIMREYHDGILLFELTDQKVWSKAMSDTVGLKEYFKQNQEDYMWDDRLDAVIYTFVTEDLAKSSRSDIRRLYRRDRSHEDLINELNADSQLNVSAEKGLFEKDDKPVLNEIEWKKGVSPVFHWNNRFFIVQVNNVLPPQPKKLNEIRGLVIADYQNFLEEKWIKELRSKYNYSVNAEVLNELK